MTKERFIKYMSLILNFYSETETLQVLISKITDGFSVVTIGDSLVVAILDIIEEDLHIAKKDDILSWWLWEDVDKVIYDGDNEISVQTLDELYDYLYAAYCV